MNQKFKKSDILFTCICALVFAGVVAAFLLYIKQIESSIVTKNSLQTAQVYSQALESFRSIYTTEVVDKVNNSQISVSHNYAHIEGAIPLPATLTMILADNLSRHSGYKASLYSPFPFPWRDDNVGLSDNFRQHAWKALNAAPSRPYYRFVNTKQGMLLRYASSDLMRESCVDCHNQHKLTPKNDWQVGDVRGVLEVQIPLWKVIDQAHKVTYQFTFIFIFMASILALVIWGFMLNIRHKGIHLKESRSHLKEEMAQRKDAQLKTLQMNRLLKKSAKYNSDIMDSLPSALLVLSPIFEIIDVNNAAIKLLGFERSELLTMSISDIISHQQDFYGEGLNGLMKSGFIKEQEVTYLGKGGVEIRVLLTGAVMRSKKGETNGIICLAQDIRGHFQSAVELRENEARMSSIINTTVDAIIMIDEKGLITTFNVAADKMFGYSAAEVLGENVKILMQDYHAHKHDDYLKMYKETGINKVIGMGRELQGRRKDGSVFPMALAVSEIVQGFSSTFTGIIRDLSERDEAQSELKKVREELQASHKVLSKTQTNLLQAAKFSSLGEMAVAIVQELRQPINIMALAFGRIHKNIKENTPSDSMNESDFEEINKQNKLMLGILEHVSHFGREVLDSQKQSFNLNGLVEKVSELFKSEHSLNKITVIKKLATDLPDLVGNAQQFELLLTNLFANAKDAVLKKETKEIEVISFLQNEEIVIQITDSGDGVKFLASEITFDSFFINKPNGTGLGFGLFICHSIIKSHGGTLSYQKKEGRGSCFIIKLPVNAAS
ncbi:MAG: PAS domain S-box protein [Bermanella sp.]